MDSRTTTSFGEKSATIMTSSVSRSTQINVKLQVSTLCSVGISCVIRCSNTDNRKVWYRIVMVDLCIFIEVEFHKAKQSLNINIYISRSPKEWTKCFVYMFFNYSSNRYKLRAKYCCHCCTTLFTTFFGLLWSLFLAVKYLLRPFAFCILLE